jgi:hypothetical protein
MPLCASPPPQGGKIEGGVMIRTPVNVSVPALLVNPVRKIAPSCTIATPHFSPLFPNPDKPEPKAYHEDAKARRNSRRSMKFNNFINSLVFFESWSLRG